MKLNFLKKTAEIKNNEVMVNAAFVEGIKSTLKEDSTSVDLSIMNKNNMLGLKVKVSNANQFPRVFESGIDSDFLDAVLDATIGEMDALKAYDPTTHRVEKGTDFKNQILHMFLGTPLPVQAHTRFMSDGSPLLEVTFQLGYCRKLRIYFKGDDAAAKYELEKAGVLKPEPKPEETTEA